jgi:hypothetical protein
MIPYNNRPYNCFFEYSGLAEISRGFSIAIFTVYITLNNKYLCKEKHVSGSNGFANGSGTKFNGPATIIS